MHSATRATPLKLRAFERVPNTFGIEERAGKQSYVRLINLELTCYMIPTVFGAVGDSPETRATQSWTDLRCDVLADRLCTKAKTQAGRGGVPT